jgi:NAD(P)-dependent dehydrogenase (short-subunit alcohol dehydrogenase family)
MSAVKTTGTTITLVTGAAAGLGRETARRLGELGHHVIVSARTAARAAETAEQLGAAGPGTFEPLELDVTDAGHRARAAEQITRRHGRLDVLVNNAGVILGEPWMGNTALTVAPDLLRRTFETNLFAVVELTQALVPLLRRSAAGRIVNVSSIMGSLAAHAPGGPLDGAKPFAYDASKTALNAFTVHLAAALKDDRILVNSAHPGWVRTALGGEYAPMTVEDGASTLVSLATLPADGPTGGFFHQGDTLPW